MSAGNSHLLVLPVPLRHVAGEYLFEAQACQGLERWADSFERLVVAVPVIPEQVVRERRNLDWKPVEKIEPSERIEFIPLPWAYRIADFYARYAEVAALLRKQIARCRYLQFAAGGWIGDWAGAGALQAVRMGRPYALHFDHIGPELMRHSATGLKRRLKAAALRWPTGCYEKMIVRRASLVLCHGSDTYNHYSRLNPRSHCVHNVHCRASDYIDEERTWQKTKEVEAGGALRICYAGRMAPEKAPGQWLKAIAMAVAAGCRIRATWLGDGELAEQMAREVRDLRLEDVVEMPGYVADRDRTMRCIQSAHVMLFTHMVRESPRCLIESLMAGTPILGYRSEYARSLVSHHGGGSFVEIGDYEALGRQLVKLDRDRVGLAKLIGEARAAGRTFTSAGVFAHRANLLKRYLP